jgi:hypothetical protein
MTLDQLIGLVESRMAQALRSVNEAALIAEHIEVHRKIDSAGRKRLKEVVKRTRAIREALFDAGVQLPPLRAPGEWSSEDSEQGE